MDNKKLFSTALNLESPWYINEIKFEKNESLNEDELHIHLDFERGSIFKSKSGEEHTAYDTRHRSWRHLNFFQHKCYIHAYVPRVKKDDGKVEQVEVSWSRAGSGFTLLFECYALKLIEYEMLVNKVGELVGEYPSRIWNILNYYVRNSYGREDHSKVRQLGIDETSTKKGHNYITVAVDMETSKVIHVTGGKDKQSVVNIRDYLNKKGSTPEQVKKSALTCHQPLLMEV